MAAESAWGRWDQLRRSTRPDPLEVLGMVTQFQRYFDAVEREAVRFARASGRTWDEIGTATGKTRQAAWQQVARDPLFEEFLREREKNAKLRWREIRRD